MTKAIDLFCGAGGMSLGVQRCGIEIVKALDNDRRHVETYNSNFTGNHAILYDLSSIEEEAIISAVDSSNQIDLVFGGPPCQGFSIGGKQKKDDIRNNLIFSFLNVVEIFRPQVFIMENVYGILGKNYSKLVQLFLTKCKEIGYNINTPIVLDAKDFAIPQNRKRVFFIGTRDPASSLCEQIQKLFLLNPKKETTVRDAIGDFNVYEDRLSSINDRFKKEFSYGSSYAQLINEEFDDSCIRVKKEKDDIGGFLVSDHTKIVVDRFTNTLPGEREPTSRYFRLHWNAVAPTLRAGTTRANGQFMASRPIHPAFPRCITVREAARLHSYPDWFEFFPTKWYGNMQIGNSVPPLLASAVTSTVFSNL